MSQLMSPSIFDSTFSASIFARRTSNLSKSSIGEFGGLYQFEIRNGLALGFWISIPSRSELASCFKMVWWAPTPAICLEDL